MTYEKIAENFELLFENKLDETSAKNFLKELYEKGEEAEEIAAGASVMRKHCLMLQLDKEFQDKLIDNCGTGGDKSNTFNISTTVSLLLASLGSYVAKHGNRSITSRSGSADMLEALGIDINLSISKQKRMLEECGFVFLFAQNHHPAMKHVMPIRKSLDHRTIFNILGPLTNPAGVSKHMVGIFDKDFVPKVAKALQMLGSRSAIVVSSKDGLDEASLSDISYYCRLKDGEIEEGVLDPALLKLECHDKNELLGGDAQENAQITYSILKGEEKGAKRDVVLLNAALALIADLRASDLKEGLEMARYAIESKKAYEKLNDIIDISKKL
jgi:anthranilate phosphoribosyltransferase